MSDTVEMIVEARDGAGKGAARAVRRAGMVPGVIYGAKKDPRLIQVDPRYIVKGLETGAFFSTIYELKIGSDTEKVLPRELQKHPINELPEHVDFMRVSDRTRVTVMVPVEFVNEEECPGIQEGGVLSITRHEVEVNCAAGNIPDIFTIDLTGLAINDSVHASSIDLPRGVAFTITDRDFAIASISAPTVVAEEDAEEQAEAEDAKDAEAEAAEEGDEEKTEG